MWINHVCYQIKILLAAARGLRRRLSSSINPFSAEADINFPSTVPYMYTYDFYKKKIMNTNQALTWPPASNWLDPLEAMLTFRVQIPSSSLNILPAHNHNTCALLHSQVCPCSLSLISYVLASTDLIKMVFFLLPNKPCFFFLFVAGKPYMSCLGPIEHPLLAGQYSIWVLLLTYVLTFSLF